jgi:hypothetical protein
MVASPRETTLVGMHHHARLRFILTFVSLTFFACAPQQPGGEREHVTALRGTITSASGAPLPGVSTSAGAIQATSDANGVYDLHVAAGAQVVSFELAGYVRSFERVTVGDGSPTQLDVTLLPMAAALPLDASTGGTVTAARGASIVAPAMAFVDASGAAVTGMVAVHLTPIDPSMGPELAASPGDFTGDMAGTRVPLESLGMMDITVESAGARLQVAPGATLEIHIPVAAGASSPDATAPVWSFDETSGIWADEGMATLDASHGTYVATTHHMSIWNIDQPYLATCVCGTVVERGAGSLPGARVDAEGLDYFGASEATTDANGRFCVAVRKSSRVSVAAYHASGGGTSREVMTGAADTNVPPTAGDPRCVDMGTLEVARDVFTTPTGTTACTETSNPFADACGRGLWTAFSCFQPSGACSIRTDTSTGGSTMTYANGARRVTTVVGTSSQTQSFDPSGTLCMTQTVGTDSVVHLTTSAGAMYTMSFPGDMSGDLVIGCPDGSMQTVTAAQRQAIQACSPHDDSTSSTCTIEGGGGTGSVCTATSECTTSGDVCCAISGAPMSYCLPQSSCP